MADLTFRKPLPNFAEAEIDPDKFYRARFMRNIQINSKIQTLVAVESDFSEQIIPKGSVGIVVEGYENPEGYAVDIPIPDERFVGDFTYENVILTPDQFMVLNDVQMYQLLFRSYNTCKTPAKKRIGARSKEKRKAKPVGAKVT